MRTWSFYRLSDGTFTGREFSAPNDKAMSANTPEGCAAIEGRYDCQSQRVDLESGRVITDEAMREEHERNASAERRRLGALTAIQALEQKQLRPMRELAIEPTNRTAADRLRSIEEEIAKHRQLLARPAGESA